MKWERRMGNDPKDSVLNKWNQMHEVNVFVTGSCMPSILFNFYGFDCARQIMQ
jgi:hypothetical protein